MKISFVSYEYQPIKTPQSLRWQKIFTHLASSRAVSISVFNPPVSAENPFYDKNFTSNYEKTIFSLSADPAPRAARVAAAQPGRAASLFKQFKHAVKKRIPLDKSFIWAIQSRAAFIDFLEKNEPDVIISSAPPFGAMVLAWMAKKHYRNRIKWICDLGDPWSFASDRQLGPVTKCLVQFAEKKFLSSADKIIVTNERTREVYLQMLKIDPSRVSVIYQGADDNRSPLPFSAGATPEFVYTGTFYKDIREPHALFKAFQTNSCKLVVAGNIDPVFRPQDTTSHISFIGNLGEQDVKRVQRCAAGLIFVDNLNSAQLPGKLFEYVATGRPIICIGVSALSPVHEVKFSDYPIVFCENNVTAITQAILRVQEIGFDNYAGTLSVGWETRSEQLGRMIDELY